jgi:folate-dependent tRNA-U54 methylase TrmFO/GidA
MKANYGILPPLEGKPVKGRRPRAELYSQRALADLDAFLIGANAANVDLE